LIAWLSTKKSSGKAVAVGAHAEFFEAEEVLQ
jgi:hypothetical protein